MPVHDRRVAHEKKIYREYQRELTQLIGPQSKEIRAYMRSFEAALSARAHPQREAAFQKSLRAANLVLVGDFHAFAPAQQEFLRVLELSAPSAGFATVALECATIHHQRALDNFLAGWITLTELRDEIDFDQNWRFPWENYREIFSCAKENGWRLRALSQGSRHPAHLRLKHRDQFAAAEIAAELGEFGPQKIFVLFGELHLARPHLPRALQQTLKGLPPRLLLLHQNLPTIYWKNAVNANETRQFLKLRRNEYCLINSSPVRKLRSYLDWAEGNSPFD